MEGRHRLEGAAQADDQYALGGVVGDKRFGTHEFLMLCELLGCEPYINGNVGSGTVQEMSEWVEYMMFEALMKQAGRFMDNITLHY